MAMGKVHKNPGLLHYFPDAGNLHDNGPDQDREEGTGQGEKAQKQGGFLVHAKDPVEKYVSSFPYSKASKRYGQQEEEGHRRDDDVLHRIEVQNRECHSSKT